MPPVKSEAQRRFLHAKDSALADTPEELDDDNESFSFPAKAKRPLPDHLKKRIATRKALKAKP